MCSGRRRRRARLGATKLGSLSRGAPWRASAAALCGESTVSRGARARRAVRCVVVPSAWRRRRLRLVASLVAGAGRAGTGPVRWKARCPVASGRAASRGRRCVGAAAAPELVLGGVAARPEEKPAREFGVVATRAAQPAAAPDGRGRRRAAVPFGGRLAVAPHAAGRRRGIMLHARPQVSRDPLGSPEAVVGVEEFASVRVPASPPRNLSGHELGLPASQRSGGVRRQRRREAKARWSRAEELGALVHGFVVPSRRSELSHS